MRDLHILVFFVMVSATSLKRSMGSSDYENCSKKLRQMILDSCGEPKGKRSAVLADHEFSINLPRLIHKPLRDIASPALLGKILGVPSQWTEELVYVDESNKQYRRNIPGAHNFIVECCVDNCSPSQIRGLCD